jgi:hypothetical protein
MIFAGTWKNEIERKRPGQMEVLGLCTSISWGGPGKREPSPPDLGLLKPFETV